MHRDYGNGTPQRAPSRSFIVNTLTYTLILVLPSRMDRGDPKLLVRAAATFPNILLTLAVNLLNPLYYLRQLWTSVRWLESLFRFFLICTTSRSIISEVLEFWKEGVSIFGYILQIIGTALIDSTQPPNHQSLTQERPESSSAPNVEHALNNEILSSSPDSTAPAPEVPSTPTHSSVPSSPPDGVRARPRPASYHGHTAAGLLSGLHTPQIQSGTTFFGGIKPLHLPHIVAVSPRLGAEKPSQPPSPTLLTLDLGPKPENDTGNAEDTVGTTRKRRIFNTRPHSLDLKSSTSVHVRSRSMSPRQRVISLPDVEPVQEDTVYSSPPDIKSFRLIPSSTGKISPEHKRTESLKAFAAQERESLLFRISELEAALRSAKATASVPHRDATESTEVFQDSKDTSLDLVDSSGPIPVSPIEQLIESDHQIHETYPSPPHSPTNNALPLAFPPSASSSSASQCMNQQKNTPHTHIISALLDQVSPSSTSTSRSPRPGPRVLLTSPTMNLGSGVDEMHWRADGKEGEQQPASLLVNPFAPIMDNQDVLSYSPTSGATEGFQR
ncbi:uncharacterized protein EI90DRAFT_3011180 [Cantharellus anzutake]|uniref:uncharacterized protein n=1 Tax=Cantharellus anzutake TaxID=1750568 RepID=UPI0019039604|nr:uncharacterized protein EI90DRAFT_3011180 [Cantharellus anzutake]KAF8342671.1 hypothetical protein EI90DRAFT_3011180 [Cantharellus anzutake]